MIINSYSVTQLLRFAYQKLGRLWPRPDFPPQMSGAELGRLHFVRIEAGASVYAREVRTGHVGMAGSGESWGEKAPQRHGEFLGILRGILAKDIP